MNAGFIKYMVQMVSKLNHQQRCHKYFCTSEAFSERHVMNFLVNLSVIYSILKRLYILFLKLSTYQLFITDHLLWSFLTELPAPAPTSHLSPVPFPHLLMHLVNSLSDQAKHTGVASFLLALITIVSHMLWNYSFSLPYSPIAFPYIFFII